MTKPEPSVEPTSSLADQVWMTLRETSEYLRLSYEYVRELAASGALKSSQATPKGKRLVRREWADQWADERAA